ISHPNSMDEQLKELIAEACKYPHQSLERQKALNRLLIQIQHLPGLAKSSHPDYFHALNRTWEWLSKNIQSFKPRPPSFQESLVKWINGYLYWRIQDLYALDKHTPYSFDGLVAPGESGLTYLEQLSQTGFSPPNLTGIDEYIEQLQRQEKQRIGLELEQYIEEDPDKRLQNCHPRESSHCNCQLLSQRLSLRDPPERLATVARELGMNYQVLVAHWKRKCLPLLQEIALSLGYEPDQEP
ncbi:hypothetical protein, partial [Coleofasciculus sp. LEGE 07092]|uniref:hypothetical protein n=1 Tax=Coleofasciculus sp. LEGE 07092 TaxID=2777969 RepID=UPI001D153CBC